MARLGIGFVAAIALASLACTGSTRSGRAGSDEGKMIATAAESGQASAPAGATAQPGAKKEVEGRVELIDRANNLVLSGTEQVGHAFDRLKLDDDTKVTVDGEEATIAEVNPGDEVRASFSGEGDELRVDQLDVISSSEASGPSSQGSGSSSQEPGSTNQR